MKKFEYLACAPARACLGPVTSPGHENCRRGSIPLLHQYGDDHVLHDREAFEEPKVLECPRDAERHGSVRIDARYVCAENSIRPPSGL